LYEAKPEALFGGSSDANHIMVFQHFTRLIRSLKGKLIRFYEGSTHPTLHDSPRKHWALSHINAFIGGNKKPLQTTYYGIP
jgi:hypothetical protein